jgi:hypothetical protein
MIRKSENHSLEFLLAFDGRVHILERGYWMKFEISRIPGTPTRPHGLRYSFTLHGPGGRRLLGFDNAHGLRGKRSRKGTPYDHWHRTDHDPGRPYVFENAEQLLDDFFDEAERILRERGIDSTVIAVDPGERQ